MIALNELLKNGLSYEQLLALAYKSRQDRSLANSLRKFDKNGLFAEIRDIIRFYQECDILDDIDMDYRIKSEDSCVRKYDKFYPEMRVEKVFNDLLGFRMLIEEVAK